MCRHVDGTMEGGEELLSIWTAAGKPDGGPIERSSWTAKEIPGAVEGLRMSVAQLRKDGCHDDATTLESVADRLSSGEVSIAEASRELGHEGW